VKTMRIEHPRFGPWVVDIRDMVIECESYGCSSTVGTRSSGNADPSPCLRPRLLPPWLRMRAREHAAKGLSSQGCSEREQLLRTSHAGIGLSSHGSARSRSAK
jgi:hypothetical protein